MNRHSNQDIEKYYFDKFRKDYSLPPGVISYGDSPDVILKGERSVGIEITNFFLQKGSRLKSEQIQSRLRQSVVSEAQRIYQKGDSKKNEISFVFDEANPIKDKKRLVNELVNLSRQIEKCETGVIRKELYETIPELCFVYLNAEGYEDVRWRVMLVYDSPIMSRDRLVEIVRGKELRAKKYRVCDVYWLLVVVDFMNRAQDQEIQFDNFKKIQSDTFEKVIVYKTLLGHILEVK